jgi:hypothetical protein
VQLVTLTARDKIPTTYAVRDFVEVGGLMSYGTDIVDMWRQVGAYCRLMTNSNLFDCSTGSSAGLAPLRMLPVQEPEPLGHHFLNENICAGRVAAGPGEARDKTKLDWVIANKEDDRDRGCCSFGRERGRVIKRSDHGHLSADQIGHQCRHALIATREPMVFDRHVLALAVASFAEAFAKCGRTRHRSIGCPNVDKSNYRQCCLLRARHEWPRAYGAPEKADEVAPPHFAFSEASGRSIVALQHRNVRFGSKADICGAQSHVRFAPNSDRKSGFPAIVLSALPPKADMSGATRDVRFGPKADNWEWVQC